MTNPALTTTTNETICNLYSQLGDRDYDLLEARCENRRITTELNEARTELAELRAELARANSELETTVQAQAVQALAELASVHFPDTVRALRKLEGF